MMQSDKFMFTAHASSFDFSATSALLISLLPTLRYLFLEADSHLTNTSRGRWPSAQHKRLDVTHSRVARGWRVEEPGTESVEDEESALVELNEHVMETVIRNEELLLWDSEFGQCTVSVVYARLKLNFVVLENRR